MKEAGIAADGLQLHLRVVGETPGVPSCPDGRTVHIHDVGTEIAAADDSHPAVVELMGFSVEFCHQPSDGHGVEHGAEVARPVILVA